MAQKTMKRARFGDSECDVEEVSIKESTERWTELLMEDGTRIKVKPVIVKVVRAIDRYDNDGQPLYSLTISQVIAVDAPEEIRKGATLPPTKR